VHAAPKTALSVWPSENRMEPGPDCREGKKKHPRQSAGATSAHVLAVFTFWRTLILSCDIFTLNKPWLSHFTFIASEYQSQTLMQTERLLSLFTLVFLICSIAIRPLYSLTCIHLIFLLFK
jgi:hypothetical protein